MLKSLVRLTSFGIAIFLSILAGIVISTADDAFPQGAEYKASLDFTHSQVSKDQAIADLDSIADASGLRLSKVVADPNDFFNSRSLYAFGKQNPQKPQDLEWFKPGMTGRLLPSSELGAASLNGPYVYSGSKSAVDQFVGWIDSHGIERNVIAKNQGSILGQALVESGAWLTFLTCVVLSFTTVITWYVLRARARSLKVLNGTPAQKIALNDLLSLLVSFGGPALAGLGVSAAAVAIEGKASRLHEYLLTAGAFLVVAAAGMILCALVVSYITWPTVDGIASRRPPENHFRTAGEVLKAATLVLVAVMLPVLGTSIGQATELANQNAKWQVLKDHVALRISVQSDAEFVSRQSELRQISESASTAGKLTLSYAFSPRMHDRPSQEPLMDTGEFDGIAVVNPDYLRVISPLLSSSGTSLQDAGKQLAFDDLPTGIKEFWSDQFPLLSREGAGPQGNAGLQYYRYTGQQPFPALPPVIGEMAEFRNPLIIVAEHPESTFNDATIAAFLSSGNLIFNDSAWVGKYLQSSSLATAVLSVDRVADAALYNSQLQNQSAGMKTLSFTLVLLALIMSIAVSGLVYALSRSKRLFVERTSGWAWGKALAPRMVWEAALACALTTGMYLALGGTARPEVLWAFAGIPLYMAISWTLHVGFAHHVFKTTLARKA
ncbi:hypothetical protein [Paenarthrobacter ureafaciens]|uniref:hypothetical protein n=1 Tax=Paenarthrobacter ureafaciens TaxID=37931 RepID=UPI002DB5FFFB|nr:hypothetical protein [Paenarthrobacter ureafaciens]MEC3852423.1 hypothetical protein [Paenarthrobacter ureafaciens]